MKARYRVRANQRFQEIRKEGEVYHSELLVLCVLANGLPYSRFGFSVSNRIGGAVIRNRIKRRLREAIRLRRDQIKPGWDMVLIARAPIRRVTYQQMDAACARLLRRAQLFQDQPLRDPIPPTHVDIRNKGERNQDDIDPGLVNRDSEP